jgi:hypothetical protein
MAPPWSTGSGNSTGRLAFPVDFIVRRRQDSRGPREPWLDGVGHVAHEETADLRLAPGRVGIGGSELTPNRSSGESGNVSWDLRWTSGGTLMNPLGGVLARLQAFDTAIVISPHARFTGSVVVAGERST